MAWARGSWICVDEKQEGMSAKSVSLTSPPDGYAECLVDLKGRIHTSQQRAILAVNQELVLLYWQIGRDISIRQADQGWLEGNRALSA